NFYEQQAANMSKNKKYKIYYFLVHNPRCIPLFFESTYVLEEHKFIYDSLKSCFFLQIGFNYYVSNKYYIDTYKYCNPNFFKLSALKNHEKLIINEKYHNKKVENFASSNQNVAYIYSNYCNHEKQQNSLNVSDQFFWGLLQYTVMKLTLETFEHNAADAHCHNLCFDRIKDIKSGNDDYCVNE
ncbi:hypothetical protein COBT_004023, partial [Conglomerata obtusa]